MDDDASNPWTKWEGHFTEWLAAVESPVPQRGLVHEFPTDGVKEEYLSKITDRGEDSVRALLRHFLVGSGSFMLDDLHREWLLYLKKNDPSRFEEVARSEFNRRILGPTPQLAWEGITWILDLLPHFPHEALTALHAYILAHAQELPDSRYGGLEDSLVVIRAKWIGDPVGNNRKLAELSQLSPRAFEHLVDELYHTLGYTTLLTPPSKDGGRDVIASTEKVGRREDLRIQCKLWAGTVGVVPVRELLGVVASEKATKGVVVTNSVFSRPATSFSDSNPRIELIDGPNVVELLNLDPPIGGLRLSHCTCRSWWSQRPHR